MPAVVAVETEHGTGAGCEADQEIGVAVGVPITEGGGARGARIRDACRSGEVDERAPVISVEAVGRPVEAHEDLGITVTVDVRECVHQRARRGEQFGLGERQLKRGSLRVGGSAHQRHRPRARGAGHEEQQK